MLSYLQANLSTILVAVVLGTLICGVIVKMVRDRRKGKSACAACSGCGGSCGADCGSGRG